MDHSKPMYLGVLNNIQFAWTIDLNQYKTLGIEHCTTNLMASRLNVFCVVPYRLDISVLH